MTDPVPLTPRPLGESLRAGPAAQVDLQARGRSFGSVAAGYAALCPTYPPDAVAFLLDGGRPLRVLDLGAGTGGHLAMEDIKARAGIRLEHVPYRGFPQATLDLVAGRISAMVVTAAAILPQVKEGTARALAVTTEQRMPQLPAVPTLEEVGLPGAASYGWQTLIAPAGTPRDRVELLAREARAALSTAQARQAMDAAAFEIVAGTPEEAAADIAAEAARWGALIRKLGLTLEG